jgi:hypothetical protein
VQEAVAAEEKHILGRVLRTHATIPSPPRGAYSGLRLGEVSIAKP